MPELTGIGIGKYTGEMAAWLAAAGHEVRVVTAPPYYPDWQVWRGYRAELGIPADAVVALYSGNMVDIMAEAARLLSDEAVLHFVFCGKGAGKAELVRLAQVRFLDLQPMALE